MQPGLDLRRSRRPTEGLETTATPALVEPEPVVEPEPLVELVETPHPTPVEVLDEEGP